MLFDVLGIGLGQILSAHRSFGFAILGLLSFFFEILRPGAFFSFRDCLGALQSSASPPYSSERYLLLRFLPEADLRVTFTSFLLHSIFPFLGPFFLRPDQAIFPLNFA